MKQQIKCPHCNKLFPLEESLKQETEELRKKLRAEEKEKSKEREKELEGKLNLKLEKQQLEHEKQLKKIKLEEYILVIMINGMEIITIKLQKNMVLRF